MPIITKDMIDCWKTNFGLDTMTPEEAFRWWAERNNGMAPAGAVVAFGLALEELEQLRKNEYICKKCGLRKEIEK